MILDRSIVEAPCFKSFLYARRMLRHLQRHRTLISSYLCTTNHAINIYKNNGSPFDTHRINVLRKRKEDLVAKLRKASNSVDDMQLSIYNCLSELSEITNPDQRAFILGNTTHWLDKADAEWRDRTLFELIFVTGSEHEKHDATRHGVPPLLWICSRMVTTMPQERMKALIEEQITIIRNEKRRPKLFLIKS